MNNKSKFKHNKFNKVLTWILISIFGIFSVLGLSGTGSLSILNADNISLFDSLLFNDGVEINNKNISKLDYINFNNTAACDTFTEAGTLCYDEDNLALSYSTGLGNIVQIGSEQWGPGKNTQGAKVFNGQITTLSGGTGGLVEFVLADASNSSRVNNLGMVTSDAGCNDNAICPITTFGLVRNLDTSSWAENTKLYLSDDGSGNLTDTIPSPPSFQFQVATVIRSHVTEGTVIFFPTVDWNNGITIGDAFVRNNVSITNNLSVANEAFFLGNVGIGTINPSSQLTVAGHADVTQNFGVGTSTMTAKLHVVNSNSSVNGFFLDHNVDTDAAKIDTESTTEAGLQILADSLRTGQDVNSAFVVRLDNESSTGTAAYIDNDGSGMDIDFDDGSYIESNTTSVSLCGPTFCFVAN